MVEIMEVIPSTAMVVSFPLVRRCFAVTDTASIQPSREGIMNVDATPKLPRTISTDETSSC